MERKRSILVTKVREEHGTEWQPGECSCSPSSPARAAHLRPGSPGLGDGRAAISFSLPPTLVPIPCPLPHCLLRSLLAATHGTQGSHLAPVVVLRAKEISDCGVSIIDNKAPRTLITWLPYVLRAHNQVRGRRVWKCCISSMGKPCPTPSLLFT